VVQLARSLRLIHPCGVEVWVFQWFFRLLLSIFPSSSSSHFILDVYFSAISHGQRCANRDYLFVTIP